MTGISRRALGKMSGLAVMAATGAVAKEPVAKKTAPTLGGLQEAVISVYDFARIARPMVEVGGYTFYPLPDAAPGQFAAWKVPKGCTRIEQAMLSQNATKGTSGSIRLVKFHGVPQRVMRSSQRSWDTGGIFDVDVFSRDVEPVYRKLQTFGWTALGDPVNYVEAEFDVMQVVAVGPDGLMLAMIQRHKPPVTDLDGYDAMSAVFNSTQMIKDFDRAVHFYIDVLGWSRALEFTINAADEPGVDVLGLPLPQARDAVRRIGMFRPPHGTGGQIELIENSTMRGKEFGEHCVAPNVGIMCLRFYMADVAGYAAEIVGRGGTLYAPPSTFLVPPYGRLTTFSVRSPEGAILEFIGAGT